MEHSRSLPYASSLCGACYEVCPVKINIPEILIHLRQKIVEHGDAPLGERAAMKAAGPALSGAGRLEAAQTLARVAQWPFERDGRLAHLPPPLNAWLRTRDLPALPPQSFRGWWASRDGEPAMSDARAEILGRIHGAIGSPAAAPRAGLRRDSAHLPPGAARSGSRIGSSCSGRGSRTTAAAASDRPPRAAARDDQPGCWRRASDSGW